MNFLDMKTVVFTGLVIDIVCTLVMVAMWRQTRRQYEGLGLWALDFSFQTAGLLLIFLRGSIPSWISVFLAAALIVSGAWLGLRGLEKFTGRKGPWLPTAMFLAAALLLHLHFSFIRPDLTLRSLNLAVALLFLFVQCAWLMLVRVDAALRPVTRWVGLVFALYAVLFLLRIAGLLGRPFPSSDYFQSGAVEAAFHLFVQVVYVLLTYSLGLMLNRRLLLTLRLQEEKFSKAFHSSPYAILLTRLADGRILEVNDGFTANTGYAAAEALGQTTVDLALWAHPEDRAIVVDRLQKHGVCDNLEMSFRRKNGELLTGLFSAAIISIRGEPCILASIADITARIRAEAERERLVAEREKALSEIKTLSGLLPICASCKKIRDDQGYWNQIEIYIRSHSEAEFSHGLCPDCAHRLYPEYAAPPRQPPPAQPPAASATAKA